MVVNCRNAWSGQHRSDRSFRLRSRRSDVCSLAISVWNRRLCRCVLCGHFLVTLRRLGARTEVNVIVVLNVPADLTVAGVTRGGCHTCMITHAATTRTSPGSVRVCEFCTLSFGKEEQLQLTTCHKMKLSDDPGQWPAWGLVQLRNLYSRGLTPMVERSFTMNLARTDALQKPGEYDANGGTTLRRSTKGQSQSQNERSHRLRRTRRRTSNGRCSHHFSPVVATSSGRTVLQRALRFTRWHSGEKKSARVPM